MKPLHKLLIGILLVVAAVAGYNLAFILPPSSPEQPAFISSNLPSTTDLIGQYRPEFSLPDLAGQPRHIKDWDGQALLINFWATWCAPCREEIPAFIAVREKFHSRGFEIVGIAIDQAEFVTEYARDFGITYPLLQGGGEALELSNLYGNQQGTLPYSVFVNAQGRITHIHNRGVLHEAELTRIVESLLSSADENEPKRSKLP